MQAPSRKTALIGEAVACAGCAALLLAIDLSPPLPSIPFIEREPAISFPVYPQTVSMTTLALLGAGVPALALVCAQIALWLRAAPRPRAATLAAALLWVGVGLAQSLLLSALATNAIKTVVGKPRPNFFALCDYRGLARAALAPGGNQTAYLAATTAGLLGDGGACAGAARDVRDAQSSFPSGHSSFSWAGLFFAALALHGVVAPPPRRSCLTAPALLAVAPLLALAAYVCATRVRDRWHDPIDVTCGAVLGAACAYAAFVHYRVTGRADTLPPLWLQSPRTPLATAAAGKAGVDVEHASQALL